MRGPIFPTWQWRGGLVQWSYTVPARSEESAAQCLERSVVETLTILSPFARVGAISTTTYDDGDDAHQFNGPDIDLPALREAIRDPGGDQGRNHGPRPLGDAGGAGTDTWLGGGAVVFFELDEQSEQDHSTKLWMSLDVDIYSPTTWGESRDNAELARLNGPRLSQFLAAIRQQLGAKLEDIDVGDYDGHVDENGFH